MFGALKHLGTPMFLDRIAISEIKIKIIYFDFQESKSFIYENLLKQGFFTNKKLYYDL